MPKKPTKNKIIKPKTDNAQLGTYSSKTLKKIIKEWESSKKAEKKYQKINTVSNFVNTQLRNLTRRI